MNRQRSLCRLSSQLLLQNGQWLSWVYQTWSPLGFILGWHLLNTQLVDIKIWWQEPTSESFQTMIRSVVWVVKDVWLPVLHEAKTDMLWLYWKVELQWDMFQEMSKTRWRQQSILLEGGWLGNTPYLFPFGEEKTSGQTQNNNINDCVIGTQTIILYYSRYYCI